MGNIKDSKKISFSIKAEDKFGNETGAFDAAPAWGLSDPAFGVMEASEDGRVATFIPNGKLGDVFVQVAGISDGKAIAGEIQMTVIPGDAVKIEIVPGEPVDQD